MSWTAERYQNYIAELKSQGDAKYREFTEKVVSTKYPIIGLRMPFLKKEAKKISRDDPESCFFFFNWGKKKKGFFL